jgi:hypothetical protein
MNRLMGWQASLFPQNHKAAVVVRDVYRTPSFMASYTSDTISNDRFRLP